MPRTWKIYKHTLLTGPKAGFSYIGQTCKVNIKNRWTNGHGYHRAQQRVFSEAIELAGGTATWDTAWSHTILEDCIQSLEEANEREKYWIAYYHTWTGDPDCHGYNMTPGGSTWGSTGRIKIFKDDIKIYIHESELESYEKQGWEKWYTPERKKIERHKYYVEHKEHEKELSYRNREKHKHPRPATIYISKTDLRVQHPELSEQELQKLYDYEYGKAYRTAHKEENKKYFADYAKTHREQVNAYSVKSYHKRKNNK